jgi:arylsulfatase A-like enzyme
LAVPSSERPDHAHPPAASLEIAARTLVGVALIDGAIAIAGRRAPAAAATTPIPTSSIAAPTPSVAPTTARAHSMEIAVRLTEVTRDATVELPNARRGYDQLLGYWRRMSSPWAGLRGTPGDRGKLVQLVSLVTSEEDKEKVRTEENGDEQKEDPRVWNQNDGAFAMRESLVTPTPGAVRFRLKVPKGGVFEASPAVMRWGDARPEGTIGDVTFTVLVAEGTAAPVEIARATVAELARNRWSELRADLAPWGGKEIELSLRADAAARRPGAALGPTTAIALWGTPRVLRPTPTPVPYNVLWIVVDALRPDALASFHDDEADAKKARAPRKAWETALPKVAGVTPAIDALAKRGTVFRHAISASHWTRPGTLAMLVGAHGDHLGIPSGKWMLGAESYDPFYASNPPLLPLAFRRAGAPTRAIVNNYFLFGYAMIGVDMGFEHVDDFHYDGPDTEQVLQTTLAALRAHKDEHGFWFVNFNSPHLPYDPPKACVERVPQGIGGIGEDTRRYLAEACKDDVAIGKLLAELDRLGMRDDTLVVVTADHGETLSGHHPDFRGTYRLSHAVHQYEETTRIPILLSLPGVIPEGGAVDTMVSSVDLAPTVLALEGLPPDARHKGVDLVRLAKGERVPGADDRAILSLGRGSVALHWSKWRYVVRDPLLDERSVRHELYDHDADPGETNNLANEPAYAATVADLKVRMRAALDDARSSTPPPRPTAEAPSPTLHLRFAGAARAQRIRGRVSARGAKSLGATPIGLPATAVVMHGESLEIDLLTSAEGVVGLDLTVTPANLAIDWSFTADGVALGDEAFFGGPLGVSLPGLSAGLVDGTARLSVTARSTPFVAADRDVGVFVTRDLGADGEHEAAPQRSDEAVAEVQRALKQWGYAK